MTQYEYNGETFFIDDAADTCEIKVSDKTNTVSITLNQNGASTYRVSTIEGNWWWHTSTVEESVNRACRVLIDYEKATPSEEACADMHKFVKNLPA